MKSIELKGNLRESVGKSNSKSLRRNEQVPCVLYGQGENMHFQIEEKAFKKLVYTPNAYIINLDIDGKAIQAILRDVQYHPITDRVIHADFFQIDEKTPVWMMIPVMLEGSSVGVLKGGRLMQRMRKLKVKALPGDLPDDITIDISDLDIGNTVKIMDLNIDKVELLDPSTNVVVMVKTARGAQTGEEEEGEEGEGEEAAEGGDAPAEEKAAE